MELQYKEMVGFLKACKPLATRLVDQGWEAVLGGEDLKALEGYERVYLAGQVYSFRLRQEAGLSLLETNWLTALLSRRKQGVIPLKIQSGLS